MKLSAYIEGIGMIGPGFTDWPGARAVLRGQQPYVPARTVLPLPALLPAAERRRSSAVVKLTLAVGMEAVQMAVVDASVLASVFSSSGSDGENCHTLCEMLASDDRQISPTRFHNSVHNTAAGYWSIATGAMTTASVISAFDASFAAGLLEALGQVVVDDRRVVLLTCDTPYPEPLHTLRPIPDALGIALVLAPQRSSAALAEIEAELTQAGGDRMNDPALEHLRIANPAARGLPLLQGIALGQEQTLVLDYLDNTGLAVSLKPC